MQMESGRNRVSRREFLKCSVCCAATATVPAALASAVSGSPDSTPGDSDGSDFSFVHLTDMHVTPKRKGDEGFLKCIEHVRALRRAPAFALMGGDLAFDGNYTAKAEFDEQIRLYKRGIEALGCRAYHCMGNHDALGWSARRKCSADDPEIGKKMIMDRLAWEKSYYSFDHGGWHFAVLDSIHPIQAKHGPTYEPRIGKEQLEWLAQDLGAAGEKPKVCMTHIAAFCNVGQMNGDPAAKAMNGSMTVWDTRELREVLERHNVVALLQGHSHRLEEYRLNGVWYLTSAAVSGAWWAGDWVGSPAGYTEFHCRGNELTWAHRTFGWEPRLEPEDELERKKIAEFAEQRRRQSELRNLERIKDR